jgi:hypothetical protein
MKGEILLKVQYKKTEVSFYKVTQVGHMMFFGDLENIFFYDDLSDFFIKISPENFAVFFDHNKFVPSQKEINAITHYIIHEPEIRSKDIIEFSVESEVNRSDEANTLFRNNSLATKIISACMNHFGKNFLQEMFDLLLKEVQNYNTDMEVDPSKLNDDEEKSKKNIEILISVVKNVIKFIINNYEKLPL